MKYCCEVRKHVSEKMQEILEETKNKHGFSEVPKVVWKDDKCPLCKQKEYESEHFVRYTPCDKCKYQGKREDCKEVRIETDAIEMWKNECEDGACLKGCTAGCELKERQ